MKLLFIFLIIILSSCSPTVVETKIETKYPEVPTMQSAEDATDGQLFKD